MARPPRADYGVDAPPVLKYALLGGTFVIGTLLSVSSYIRVSHPKTGGILATVAVVGGALNSLVAFLMLLSSRSGKLRERERVLDSIAWSGNESVLDVGCGKGLLLNGAAKRLQGGRVVGIDFWNKPDITGGHADVATANADAEGVAHRVEVRSADPRHLPFPDASFDVVLSGLFLHEFSDPQGRERALHEMERVLKPGGQLRIIDWRYTGHYATFLASNGMYGVQRSGLRFTVFPPVRLVQATKPSVHVA